MQLPFTLDQFLDVFAAYNRTLWPGVLLLWIATLVMVGRLWRGGAGASRSFSLLLALHWAWAGLVYHIAFFRSINPAAVLFGALFVVQAGLFLWRGVLRRGIEFAPTVSLWSRLGVGLMVYALLYPGVGLAFGMEYPRMPTFGVPCPTTILTAGALMTVRGPGVRWLAIIPILWSVVGSSAAFFLGIHADLLLVVAGILILGHVARPLRTSPARELQAFG